MKALTCSLLCCLLFCCNSKLFAQSLNPVFARHVQSLNELTERRRTNRLFHNTQTENVGQTVGYTNANKGNTTFAMRDLVLIHQQPMTLTRVYDSDLTQPSDFGLGWRLSYNEHIQQHNKDELIYTDDSGSQQLLKDVEWLSHNQLRLIDSNDFSKIFTFIDDSYKLSQITNNKGHSIHIEYQNNLIHRIYNDHKQFIILTRNAYGYIESISDHHGRTLHYQYKNHHLISSQDLAGYWWRYRYQNNQLSRIKDPEGRLAAKFTYYRNDENDGKTKRAKVGTQDNRFYYQQNAITVINNLGKATHFEQNQHGKTVTTTNHLGQTITLPRLVKKPSKTHSNISSHDNALYNDKGLLIQLQQNGDIAKFDYNKFGQLEKITFPNGNFHKYHYNQLGFRTKTTRSDGSTIDYSYDKTGNLLTLTEINHNGESQFKQMILNQDNLTTAYIVDGQMMLDITYDRAGNPERIAYNGNSVSYEYDELNRLTTVIDGEQMLNYYYEKNQPDIRIQQDDRTFTSHGSSRRGISPQKTQPNGINHNNLDINRLYTRTSANYTPFKHIRNTTIQQDANQRRRLYNVLATDKQGQRNFDKPSNSFFMPPTYRAINCEADYCWELIQVDLAGPSQVSVGQSATFTATSLLGYMFDEFDKCNVQYQFSVNGDIKAYNTSGIFNYTFGTTGPQQVQVRASCQNCAAFNFQYATTYLQSYGLPKVTILNADVTQDKITVKLEPQGLNGVLEIALTKADNSQIQLISENKVGSTYQFSFNIDNLPDNTTFSTITASWNTGSSKVKDTHPYRFMTLGVYRHTQYNMPAQTDPTCNVGTTQDVFITTEFLYISKCFNDDALYYQTQFNSTFKAQLNLNGAGITQLHGIVQRDWYCSSQANRPIDADFTNTYREVFVPEPQCGPEYNLNNNTVAVPAAHVYLSCGDRIYIRDIGIKTVTDHCPACGDNKIDNFTLNTNLCTGVPDLISAAKTIKLLD